MRIGIPREIKPLEGRVGLIPAAAAELVKLGHELFIERGAGELSGYCDEQYTALGIELQPDAATLYAAAEMIIKVKEPVEPEIGLLRKDHLLFSYLHLAAEPELTQKLLDIGLMGVAFETVEENRQLPLLAPMSDIAGRLATQIGTTLLHQPNGGKGILLGGLPAAPRGRVVILGGGVAGGGAATLAASMGAEVVVFEKDRVKLEQMRALGPNVTALYAYHDLIAEEVARADLLIGAVLIPGAKAPHLVSQEMVKSMEHGSVVIDIAVDQGGCIETTRPTNYQAPTFVWEGVVHFCVTNMPGAVPRSASQALSAALIPYAIKLASGELEQHASLRAGINVRDGGIIHPELIQLALKQS